VLAALDASPSRIPLLLGGCGTGRTTLVQQVRDRIGRTASQYIDVERTATTPERFLRAVTAPSPFPPIDVTAASTREAIDATLAFFDRVRLAGGESATFVLDEFLELRTFESFPGLRRVVHDTIDALASSGNRFVLTSRYTARALRLLRDRSARFEVIHMPALTTEDTQDMLGPTAGSDANEAEYLARTVQALADGRPMYVRALCDELAAMRQQGGPVDAVGALASLLAPGGRLADKCWFCYELRLHRARGYGALKAILEILGDEEGLTLTELSHRLNRTPGQPKTTSRAKCIAMRCRASRTRPKRKPSGRRANRRWRWPARARAVGSSRSTEPSSSTLPEPRSHEEPEGTFVDQTTSCVFVSSWSRRSRNPRQLR